MDFRKLAWPDRHLLSPRRKAVSGFSVWVGVSLIFLSLLLLSNSLKGRVVAPFPSLSTSTTANKEVEDSSTSGSNSSSGDFAVEPLEANVVSSVVLGKTHFDGDGRNGSSDVAAPPHLSDVLNNGSSPVVAQNKSVENSTSWNSTIAKNKNDKAINSSSSSNLGIGDVERETGEEKKVAFGECDLFDGQWVKDNSKPFYRPGSCPFVDSSFDCYRNGRPDKGFVTWRWQPNGCDIPRLNATDFLERLRGKKLVFVGDSLNRNMWESLVCILRQSVRYKKRVYEISGRTEFKKKGFYAFMFQDYNCTVDFVASPFLVRESSFSSKNGTYETLRLDLMDKTTSMYHDADVLVFNTGHWWTHEKTSKGENYYQVGDYVYPRLKALEAYKMALATWAKWVDKNIDNSRTQVFFRGYSVTHFKGGQWNSGGQCHKETEPIFNPAYLGKYPSKMRAFQNVLQEMKFPVIYLNISRLTDYRKDGHPSIYRMKYKTPEEWNAAERSQDCSHWCLPGVPDTWNELLYASLLKSGNGSWKI